MLVIVSKFTREGDKNTIFINQNDEKQVTSSIYLNKPYDATSGIFPAI